MFNTLHNKDLVKRFLHIVTTSNAIINLSSQQISSYVVMHVFMNEDLNHLGVP